MGGRWEQLRLESATHLPFRAGHNWMHYGQNGFGVWEASASHIFCCSFTKNALHFLHKTFLNILVCFSRWWYSNIVSRTYQNFPIYSNTNGRPPTRTEQGIKVLGGYGNDTRKAMVECNWINYMGKYCACWSWNWFIYWRNNWYRVRFNACFMFVNSNFYVLSYKKMDT